MNQGRGKKRVSEQLLTRVKEGATFLLFLINTASCCGKGCLSVPVSVMVRVYSWVTSWSRPLVDLGITDINSSG